ncbi:hypothetical protein G9A89_019171 [Geosiphon pyriformis]|nr:hypothetical protein G9A89_019171 [Geosiphon pyriformis]
MEKTFVLSNDSQEDTSDLNVEGITSHSRLSSEKTSITCTDLEKQCTKEKLISVAIDDDDDFYFTSRKSVSLAWKNLSYTITNSRNKKEDKIIQCMSGIVNPGEFLAILGPSGSGKTTLLDLLSGRKDPKLVSGEVLLNGRHGNIKYVSKYVMQDDQMIGVLTVRENIEYAAEFCLPTSYSAAQKMKRVNDIIQEFGLERVANSKIGNVFVRGVSGGEKRRASIASQVITLPSMIFLDEPTTGLDSAASYNVMKAIVGMARKYKLTIIASIHQPSTETYSLFDKVAFIVRGRTAYIGSREGAIPHFNELGYKCPPYSNPADYILSLINSDFITDKSQAQTYLTKFIDGFEISSTNLELGEKISQLIEFHQSDHDTREISSETNKRYARSFFAQTHIIMRRAFINALRNVLMFWTRVILYSTLGLMMGSLWWNIGYEQEQVLERLASLYFTIAFLTFMSIAAIPGFLEERAVFERERFNGFYSVGPYVLSTSLVCIPFLSLITICFTFTVYPTISYNHDFYRALDYVIIIFLVLMISEALVVFIAAIIPEFVAALGITSFVNGFFMIFAGFLKLYKNLPTAWKWANYINYQKYAFEAIISNDLNGLTFKCETLDLAVIDPSGSLSLLVGNNNYYHCNFGDKSGRSESFSGSDILKDLKWDDIIYWRWVLILVGYVIAYRLAFYVLLRIRRLHI